MPRPRSIIRRFSLVLSRLGGGMLLAAALLVAVEVVLRKSGLVVFSLGTELSSYALAIGSAWALAHVVFERGHVRVDVITMRLPDACRAGFDVLALASLALVGSILSLGAWSTFSTSYANGTTANTPLATPLALPQGLWLFGICWFSLVSIWQTGRAISALLNRDIAEVARIAGAPSAEDEASESVREARNIVEVRT